MRRYVYRGLFSVSPCLVSRPVGPHCAIILPVRVESILSWNINRCLSCLAGIWNLVFLKKELEDNSWFLVRVC